MRITETDRLLVLFAETLDSVIFPELHSDRAKATADMLRALLAELRKREHDMPALLRRSIEDGRALLEALRVQLPTTSADTEERPIADAGSSDLKRLIEQHAALTAALSELARRLQQRAATLPSEQRQALSERLRQIAQWESAFGTQESGAQCPAPPPREAEAGGQPLTAETLQAFLCRHHPAGNDLIVTDFAAVPGGFGKQTSRFTVRGADGHEQPLIARKMDAAPLLNTGMFKLEREFHLLKSLSATGYPAPKPLYLALRADGVDASFYVMERLPGTVPGSYLTGMNNAPSEALVLDIAEQMASLHAVPLAALSDYIERFEDPALLTSMTVRQCYAARLAELQRYRLEEVEHLPSPALTYLADWLERNMPMDDRRPVLVHGDFNIHNLLVESDRISGVLDWECALFGAPEQELAYIQPHISKLIDWERFVAHYERCAGYSVDRGALAYYMAFSMFPVNIAMSRGIRNLQVGCNRDIRYAMIELAFGPQFMQMGIGATLN